MRCWNEAYAPKMLCRGGSESVERALNTASTAIQHVAVNHSCPYVVMPQEFLDCSDIVAGLQQVRGEAVTKAMACCGFGDSTTPDGLLHCLLHDRLMQMMPALYVQF